MLQKMLIWLRVVVDIIKQMRANAIYQKYWREFKSIWTSKLFLPVSSKVTICFLLTEFYRYKKRSKFLIVKEPEFKPSFCRNIWKLQTSFFLIFFWRYVSTFALQFVMCTNYQFLSSPTKPCVFLSFIYFIYTLILKNLARRESYNLS